MEKWSWYVKNGNVLYYWLWVPLLVKSAILLMSIWLSIIHMILTREISVIKFFLQSSHDIRNTFAVLSPLLLLTVVWCFWFYTYIVVVMQRRFIKMLILIRQRSISRIIVTITVGIVRCRGLMIRCGRIRNVVRILVCHIVTVSDRNHLWSCVGRRYTLIAWECR